VPIDGWDYMPRGYGLVVDLQRAPRWLRLWHRVPVLDRFSYPRLIRIGVARLIPSPGWSEDEREPVPAGWTVEDG
jgi:hypothetical protein